MAQDADKALQEAVTLLRATTRAMDAPEWLRARDAFLKSLEPDPVAVLDGFFGVTPQGLVGVMNGLQCEARTLEDFRAGDEAWQAIRRRLQSQPTVDEGEVERELDAWMAERGWAAPTTGNSLAEQTVRYQISTFFTARRHHAERRDRGEG